MASSSSSAAGAKSFEPHPVMDISEEHNGRFQIQDGTDITGFSFGAKTAASGEVVFNTGMVGYPEALTDPSYRGQILILTYPIIGNYGVPSEEEIDSFGLPAHFESDKIQITGLIVQDYSHVPSHYKSIQALGKWLAKHNVPALYGVDTRALTKKLRSKGAMLGKITFGEDIEYSNPNERNLVAEVSRKEPQTFGQGKFKILAVDCGIKNNIIRYLASKDIELKVVPWDHDIVNENYDGLFISNGPGDPSMVDKTVENLKKVFEKSDKPVFGICLGNQLMARAAGAKTYKMKFGNRGMNQPCVDLRTTLCYITAQNHGYAVDNSTLPEEWKPMFQNANDHSNEGIIHSYKPFFSVQFHPEAMGGPTDTEFLFDMFLDRVKTGRQQVTTVTLPPPQRPVNKVLLLGSGGLSIGQAGEFDYSGSQAIKALKEENIEVILINPNIATVQTSPGMADRTYFLPVTKEYVTDVIKKERPDGILLQFGGQTALNCGIDLEKGGVLKEYDVEVLGTQIPVIEATEDRDIFSQKLAEINEHTALSYSATTIKEAQEAADKIGFPVLVRAAFALGGLGSGFAHNHDELLVLLKKAFSTASQVIIDESLRGWKEVEYEVVRDNKDNTITVCNMENFDPLGIHTGDSIVIAPSQTLTNKEYFMLRKTAIKVVKHLGVVGECNIQYALDPNSDRYCIIEVNARLSRSSALASKATGYPLAYVAAKLALGKALTDIKNSVTKTTTACFEPALDYLVVKIPRWDMRKFTHVSASLGSAMKSVGEVMAIGRNFEETFQKAIRMVDGGLDGFGDNSPMALDENCSDAELRQLLANPSDIRVYALGVALQRGFSVDELFELTHIDRWFLTKLLNIQRVQNTIAKMKGLNDINATAMKHIKRAGFSDRQIGRILGIKDQIEVRNHRINLNVMPVVKQIDTLAAEFPAQTNYLYMTYSGDEHDVSFDEHGVMVLGCGAYRIGSSCEFDWCAVSCLRTLRKLGHKSVMVNYNPETVSTDYDECDRLYFEELTLERVLDIYQMEQGAGVVVSVGGQIPNNLSIPLAANGAKILGTTPKSIDNAEDRSKFSQMLDDLEVDQPRWAELSTIDEAKTFATSVGYPVLVRPSYVLSGAAMAVAANEVDLVGYLGTAAALDNDAPVVISKFVERAKEIDYDGVANGGKIINYAISEHIENAGVHSGDATLLLPAQKLYVETVKRIKHIAAKIAAKLEITGPFNIQFLSKNNAIKVIECNLRSSRSLPFVSKTFDVNFVEQATRAMVGAPTKPMRIDLYDIDHVCIKCPMFSFTRLAGADPVTSVEMASTGEVACFGRNMYEAYITSLLSTGFKVPTKDIVVAAGPLSSKLEFLPAAETLVRLGYKLYGTTGTAEFYTKHGIPMTTAYKPNQEGSPKVVELLQNDKVDLIINIPQSLETAELTSGYKIRRTAVDFSVSLISNIKCAVLFVEALQMLKTNKKPEPLSWQEIQMNSLNRRSGL